MAIEKEKADFEKKVWASNNQGNFDLRAIVELNIPSERALFQLLNATFILENGISNNNINYISQVMLRERADFESL